MWNIVLIEKDGSIQRGSGSIEQCFARLENIMQGDQEKVEAAKADLSRVGARYHEFNGGTLVLASLD